MPKIRLAVRLAALLLLAGSGGCAAAAGPPVAVSWIGGQSMIFGEDEFTLLFSADGPVSARKLAAEYDDRQARLTLTVDGVELASPLPGRVEPGSRLVSRLWLAVDDGRLVITLSTVGLAAAEWLRLDDDGRRWAAIVRRLPEDGGYSRQGVSKAVKGQRIVVDPGHGGSDCGAIGPDGIREADVNLAVGLKVVELLRDAGGDVRLTRTADVDVCRPGASDSEELAARVAVANNWPAAVFVSVHCDAVDRAGANGQGTFYYPKQTDDLILANSLCDSLDDLLGLSNRGGREAGFYVLRHTAMPAALVEMAFISNPGEEKLLAGQDGQFRFALAIARGIADYFDLKVRQAAAAGGDGKDG
ncbi:MAG: N-acetylmuramoyl-L-alanine amidase [Negativicutes bacterium]|nr:N-acetylmuramoyl-L-alanine amidase [Negativicutes bacterium]